MFTPCNGTHSPGWEFVSFSLYIASLLDFLIGSNRCQNARWNRETTTTHNQPTDAQQLHEWMKNHFSKWQKADQTDNCGEVEPSRAWIHFCMHGLLSQLRNGSPTTYSDTREQLEPPTVVFFILSHACTLLPWVTSNHHWLRIEGEEVTCEQRRDDIGMHSLLARSCIRTYVRAGSQWR